MNPLIEEGASFLTGLGFYTRIPLLKRLRWSGERLNRSTLWLPFYGLLIGALAAGIFLLFSQWISTSASLVFSMAATVLFTGAFHEDGFADSCDGLGGGWTREDKLKIMKDSRIGTYGAIGLILILLLKFFLLENLPTEYLPRALLLGHMLSRLLPVLLIRSLPYARTDGSGKNKPVSSGISLTRTLSACLLSALLILLILWFFHRPLWGNPPSSEWLLLPLVFLLFFPARAVMKHHLGGYTGDLLGASQQIAEVSIYLTLGVLWHFGL